MTLKVSKDGTVTQGTDVIGRVEKREMNGLHATDTGIGFGGAKWFAYAPDGTLVRDIGDSTRKLAVDRLVKRAEPLTVRDVKRETVYGLLGGDPRECVTADVRWQGNYASVSRYPHEEAWVVDCLIKAGTMMPVFSHGTGARYTALYGLLPEQGDAVTAEAVRLGLLPA